MDVFERKGSNALREYLKERELAHDSIVRNFTNIRTILNFALAEIFLQPSTGFRGVFLGDATAPKKRYVPTPEALIKSQCRCKSHDNELRWWRQTNRLKHQKPADCKRYEAIKERYSLRAASRFSL